MGSHLETARYRLRLRCTRCDHQYTRMVKRLTDPDPPCPKKACREAGAAEEMERMKENMRRIIAEESAPGIGGSIVGKAIEKTAEICMQDYGLTDLKDNVRVGETAVPRLPPHQQDRVDNFFGAPKASKNPAVAQAVSVMGARAMAGSYAPQRGSHITDYVLSPEKGPALKPPIRIIAG